MSAPRRRRSAVGHRAVLWCAAATLIASVADAGAAPPAPSVAIDGMRFEPEVVTVRPGERVTWINRDLVPHTVTHPAFDSGTLEPGASWTLAAGGPGTYQYVCSLHPLMRATLIVRKE